MLFPYLVNLNDNELRFHNIFWAMMILLLFNSNDLKGMSYLQLSAEHNINLLGFLLSLLPLKYNEINDDQF